MSVLLAALLLDGIAGEPRWLWSRLPHPAVVIGRAIGWADQRFNTGAARKPKGTLFIGALLAASLAVGAALSNLGWVVEALVASMLLAQRSLAEHVAAVAEGLNLSLAEGRRRVAMIVGRDTAEMDEAAVSRAAIESAAENLSDGVIAPAFWFVIGGLPGMLAYKAVNTADSMVGYLTPRHAEFGWAAAKLDDLANWGPSRITAFLILLADLRLGSWSDVARDASRHRSPNAGWPEAALARSLDVSLSGPRRYQGKEEPFAYVHAQGRHDANKRDIVRAVEALWRVWWFAIGGTAALAVTTALF
ncbi:MAG: adenosylcobinamide-phosphate synthase CbiB [Pseudomonadota bacterium]